jgi:hypothetical protein
MCNFAFRYEVRVFGNLISSFVFTSRESMEDWLTTEFPRLESEYGKLSYERKNLPGLRVGDQCNVYGEGHEIFEIVGIHESSDNRYSFQLDNGVSEEVGKCHKGFLYV